jgi:hypothetical protein
MIAYTCVRSAVVPACGNIKGRLRFIKYPRKRLAMVGTPYHRVCPANFLIPLKGFGIFYKCNP